MNGDPSNSAAIWARAIQPSRGTLTGDAARAILAWRLSGRDLNRADALARGAADGALSAEEAAELKDHLTVATALELLKSKARRSLKAGGGRPSGAPESRKRR